MAFPNPLRSKDLTLPIGRSHDLRLVECPGRSLDGEAVASLVADLRQIADRCVPSGTLRYGVLSGETERLSQVLVAIVYERGTRRPVGFNAMSWLEVTVGGRTERMLHAGLCMIEPGARRGGLLGLLSAVPAVLAFARNRFAPLWVSNVTQVPAVAGRFSQAVGHVYPAPGISRPPSPEHVAIASQIMERHRAVFGVGGEATFDAERFVIRNAYTGGSDELKKRWEETGKHRDERINGLCRDLLDYERGDDLLQLGRLSVGVVASLVADLAVRLLRRKSRELRASRHPGRDAARPHLEQVA